MRPRPWPQRASRPSRSLTAAAPALALAASLAAGCALLVPGTLTDVRCTAEGAVGPPVCPAGTFCHEGLCRAGPPPLGEPCSVEDVCGPGDHCVDLAAWGISADELCTRPCCSSADCGAGTDLVCSFLGPGKLCVPAQAASRSAPGDRYAAEPCERSSDCRSGECSEHGLCIDTCCSDAECAAFRAACRAGPAGWTCEPDPGPRAEYPLPCKADEDCASGLCVAWNDGAHRCARPCCSSAECGQTKVADGLRNILCVPVLRGAASVLACAAAAPEGAERAVGEPCDHDGQCRGGRCVDLPPSSSRPALSKTCSDACCTDASCGAPHLHACAPSAGWEGGASEPPLGAAQGFDLQCTSR